MLGFVGFIKKSLELEGKLPDKWKDTYTPGDATYPDFLKNIKVVNGALSCPSGTYKTLDGTKSFIYSGEEIYSDSIQYEQQENIMSNSDWSASEFSACELYYVKDGDESWTASWGTSYSEPDMIGSGTAASPLHDSYAYKAFRTGSMCVSDNVSSSTASSWKRGLKFVATFKDDSVHRTRTKFELSGFYITNNSKANPANYTLTITLKYTDGTSEVKEFTGSVRVDSYSGARASFERENGDKEIQGLEILWMVEKAIPGTGVSYFYSKYIPSYSGDVYLARQYNKYQEEENINFQLVTDNENFEDNDETVEMQFSVTSSYLGKIDCPAGVVKINSFKPYPDVQPDSLSS